MFFGCIQCRRDLCNSGGSERRFQGGFAEDLKRSVGSLLLTPRVRERSERVPVWVGDLMAFTLENPRIFLENPRIVLENPRIVLENPRMF